MLFAFLLGTSGSALGAYDYSSPEVHSGNFLLWEAEASAEWPLELADSTKGIGVWVYDEALGVPVYVRQNPWSKFDPTGLFEIYVHTQGRIAARLGGGYPIGHVGITTKSKEGFTHFDTGRYRGIYKGEKNLGPNVHVRTSGGVAPDSEKEGFKTYNFVVDPKIDQAIHDAFQAKFDGGKKQYPKNIESKIDPKSVEGRTTTLAENERYAGTDWEAFGCNCKSETFGTITKSMRQIMEDNSVNPDIRAQAEAVHNYMNHIGESLGPAGVKTALEWTTHEGKNFNFVKNQRTERTEPSKEAAEKEEQNEDKE